MVGRPKGTPKTGGRKKGTPNKSTLAIKEVAQKHGGDAIKTLVWLMHNAENENTKRAAATDLLDRGYGRPHQSISGQDGSAAIQITIGGGDGRVL